MGTLESDAVPLHRTHVKPVAEDAVNGPPLKGISPSGAVSPPVAFSGDRGQVMAVVVISKDKFYYGILRLINDIGLSVPHSLVAEARRGLITVAESLFRHAPEHLSGQIDGVILIKPFNDGLNEPSKHSLRYGL